MGHVLERVAGSCLPVAQLDRFLRLSVILEIVESLSDDVANFRWRRFQNRRLFFEDVFYLGFDFLVRERAEDFRGGRVDSVVPQRVQLADGVAPVRPLRRALRSVPEGAGQCRSWC